MKKIRISRRIRKILYVCLFIAGLYLMISVISGFLLALSWIIGMGDLKDKTVSTILFLGAFFILGFLIKIAIKNLSLIKKQPSKNP